MTNVDLPAFAGPATPGRGFPVGRRASRETTRSGNGAPPTVPSWRRARIVVQQQAATERAFEDEEDPLERLLAAREAASYERLKARLGGGAEVEDALGEVMKDLKSTQALEQMADRRRRALRVMQGLTEYPTEEEQVDEVEEERGFFIDDYWENSKNERNRPTGAAGNVVRFLEGFERKTSSLFDKSTADDAEAQDIAQKTGWAFFSLVGFYFALRLALGFISFFAKFTFSFVAIFLLSAGIFIVFYIVRF